MTYPYGDGEDILAGLNPTPAERLAYLRVLDEVEAEEAAGLPPGEPGPDPDGPWHDFHAAAAQMDTDAQRDAARLAQDVADQIPDRRPPTDETKLSRALDRVASETYLPPQQFPLTWDAHGMYAPGACGDTDQGYCTSRYHDPGCSSTVAGTAAVESVASAQAWRDTLANHPPDPGTLGYTAELAGPADPADMFSDLLAPPGSADPATVHARMLAELGEAEPPAREPREQYPDVAGIRSAMGI